MELNWNFRKHSNQFGLDVGDESAVLTRKQFIEGIYLGCLGSTKTANFQDAIAAVVSIFSKFYEAYEARLDPMYFRLNQLWRVNVNQVLLTNLQVI